MNFTLASADKKCNDPFARSVVIVEMLFSLLLSLTLLDSSFSRMLDKNAFMNMILLPMDYLHEDFYRLDF